jgi:glutamate racemase
LLSQPGADRIDSIALGCTHYTFLLPEFLTLHPELQWFDPAGAVARQTAAITGSLPTAPPSPRTNTVFFTASRPDAAIVDAGLRAYGFTQSLQLPLN